MAQEVSDDIDKRKVCENIATVLSILLFLGLIISGGIFFNDCPSPPLLPISMIVQGSLSIFVPLMFVIKFRFEAPISSTLYYTMVISDSVLSAGWLFVFTHWLVNADCPSDGPHKTGNVFCAVLWVIGVPVLCCTLYRKRRVYMSLFCQN